MARKVQVHLLDDMDGSQADETLRFGLDGMNYEIDLSAKHAEKLRATLAKFVLSSRRVGRSRVTVPQPRGGARAPARGGPGPEPAVPGWGQRKGIPDSDPGRPSAHNT